MTRSYNDKTEQRTTLTFIFLCFLAISAVVLISVSYLKSRRVAVASEQVYSKASDQEFEDLHNRVDEIEKNLEAVIKAYKEQSTN
jgi:hypothetical protein